MFKRIIVQAAFLKDGLVVKVGEQATPEQIKQAVLAAIPAEFRSNDLQVVDEADDDQETREFGDNEELRHGRVVHVGRCLLVEVSVRYAGRVVDRRFLPATRVGRVRRWALNKLEINHADANELVLQIAGTAVQPSRDQHVGSFVGHGTCVVTFDLVRSYTVNGDASVSTDHANLLEDLERASFLLGAIHKRWRFGDIAWPHAFFGVTARDEVEYTLRLQCDGYPGAPTGAFWDTANNTWLPAQRWPQTGPRFGAALRTDWQGGTALYIPCDRLGIAGHEPWLNLHPAWVWDPEVGIARYLDVVWTMLNGEDYVAPAA